MNLGMEIAKRTIGAAIGVPVLIAAGIVTFILTTKNKNKENEKIEEEEPKKPDNSEEEAESESDEGIVTEDIL